MSKLLFELLPSDVLMDKSKNFLNKSIWYHANEIKNSNNKLFSNEIKKIIELSSKNEISDTPFSWYALNTVKYLRSKELNDSKGKNGFFSVKDMVANFAGLFVAISIINY